MGRSFGLFLSVVVLCSCAAATTVVFRDYMDRPVVYRSHRTNQCVKVETAPSRKPLTCAEVREHKYELVWVK